MPGWQFFALVALTFGITAPAMCLAQTTAAQDAASARTSLKAYLEHFDADLKGRFTDALVDLNGAVSRKRSST
jgi:hypothetical protein